MGQAILIAAGVLLLFAAGAGLGYWLGNTNRKRDGVTAAEVRAEYDGYRERVTSHFGQAAEHFQTIGREYRALYDHMARSADTLSDAPKGTHELSFMPAAAVTNDEPAAAEETTSAESSERAAAAESPLEEDAETGDDTRTSDVAAEPARAVESASEAGPPPDYADESVPDGEPKAPTDKPAAAKPGKAGERTYH